MKRANKLQCLTLCETYAKNSNDPHRKVGALLVLVKNKELSILQEGYNCLPQKYENEHICYKDLEGHTKPEVIHAEANAIKYMFENNNQFSLMNGFHYELFCTTSPCMECAKLIYLSGIKKIYFKEYWKDRKPLQFLKDLGIKHEQIK